MHPRLRRTRRFCLFVVGAAMLCVAPVRSDDGSRDPGPATLEDLYGDTAEFFQGSIGLWAFEVTPQQPQPAVSYGVGIDDVVVEWREFTLVQDSTDCAAGECAVVSLDSNNTFEGSTELTISVLEKSPDPDNDCDLNGSLDGTNDCDGDGRPDLVVRATSDAEIQGEIAFANATGGPFEYRADLPISSLYDSPGVLFVGQFGGTLPRVTVTYTDGDDGTGQPCRNDVDPQAWGRVQATTTVFLTTAEAAISVISTERTDNGDGDGFPDTNETVELRIRVANRSSQNLTNVAARLATNDPKIDCILDVFVDIGDLAAGAEVLSTDGFTFHVADVDRTASGLTDLDDFSAEFQLLFSADQFDALAVPQNLVLDVDLDAEGGSGPTTFFEGFESGTFGAFTEMNIDAGRNTLTGSDGYRCQYSDPDWIGSNSYGAITHCYLGGSPTHADAYFWQVHTPAAIDGGKAYSGANSLYMGMFGPAADEHTTPFAVLEAVRLEDPINLGFIGESSELSLKQQIRFYEQRTRLIASGRGVAQIQVADGVGDPVGNWIKLQPYVNVYDLPAVQNFFNCLFDPIDDGNTEDDFFDPTDPDRRLGPSSTCYPEFNWVNQGETFRPFAEQNIGAASDGPGLEGSLGLGTWVEPRFNLERFRGRRVRLRFLNSDLKAGSFETWEQIFTFNPAPDDDGWWIDDVRVTNTLVNPATITSDDKNNDALPGCGNTCNTVSARLMSDPAGSSAAPGRVVELSALESMADRCLNGVLQYRFWIDGNGSGSGGDPADTLLRGWTDNPAILDAPGVRTSYVVEVRCSTATSCSDSATLTVDVACPSSGNLLFPHVVAPDRDTLVWGSSRTYDFAEGRLANLSSYQTTDQGQQQGPAAALNIGDDFPAAGTGLWYLLRDSGALGSGATQFCNAPGVTWGQASRDDVLP